MFKKVLIAVAVIAALGAVLFMATRTGKENIPSPTPSISPVASPTRSTTVTVPPSKTPTPSPSKTATPSPTQTHTPTPPPTHTPTPTPSPTSSQTPSPSPTPPPGPQTYSIKIEDFAFFPGTLNVKPGDIVRFTNYDPYDHSAVDDGGNWETPVLSRGESYDLDTSSLAVGTYRYHCGIHGQAMVGTIRITP